MEFTLDFQRKILACLYRLPVFMQQNCTLVSEGMFDAATYSLLSTVLTTFWNEHTVLPSKTSILQVLTNAGQASGTIEGISSLLDELDKENLEDIVFVEQQISIFARVQAIVRAIEENNRLLTVGEVEDFQSILQKAFLVGTHREFGIDFFDHEPEFEEDIVNAVPTLIPPLDARIGWGLLPGELGVWLGDTGMGKTHALIHCAKAGVYFRKNVVMYTFEMSHEQLVVRLSSSFIGVPPQQLRFSRAKLRAFRNHMRLCAGKLLIKEFPMGGATVAQLKEHLYSLDFVPGLVVVDYADVMKPTKDYDDLYRTIGAVYEQLKGLAQEFHVPVWTASQASRESRKVEQVDLIHIADSYEKARKADVIVGMSQNEQERQDHIMRLTLNKSRKSAGGMTFEIRQDYNRMLFYKIDVNTASFANRG